MYTINSSEVVAKTFVSNRGQVVNTSSNEYLKGFLQIIHGQKHDDKENTA